MKKYLLVASIALLPAAVSAQAPAPASAPAKPLVRAELVKELDASFTRIDTNRDEVVTKVEADASQERARQQNLTRLQQRAEQQFAQLDTDKNGQISLAEFKAIAAVARVTSGEAAIAMLDANKDQKLTLQEFRSKRLAEFDALDADRNGQLTQLEVNRKR